MSRTKIIPVDVAVLAAVRHACAGCGTKQACCCASFDVCVTRREMRIITGAMPVAAAFQPALKIRGGFQNVFDETDDGLFALDTDANGLCVFAYASGGGIRCALHSAALLLGVSPVSLKPAVCVLWPMTFTDVPDSRLTISENAFDFDCCRKPGGKKRRTIAPALLESVADLFGEGAKKALVAAAKNGLRRARIPVGGVR